MAKKIEKKKGAKKKLVTLDNIKAAVIVELTKEFEANKKLVTKAKNPVVIEDNVYCSRKIINLIECFYTQEEECL
jgi:ribosome biogenesis protein Tsr3